MTKGETPLLKLYQGFILFRPRFSNCWMYMWL